MAHRVTNDDIANAMRHYQTALAAHGIYIDSLTVAAPYGQVLYLFRYEDHMPVHDLPGFVGSGGSGFLTKREAYDRISQAARTLFDLADALDRRQEVAS